MNYAVRGTAMIHEQLVTGTLGKSLLLIDNLDKDIRLSEMERNSFLSTPVKYVSSMSLLVCLDGDIKLDIGLREYEMYSEEALLLGSGIICEIQRMPHDTKFFSIVFSEEFCYPLSEQVDSALFRKAFASNPICQVKNVEEYVKIYKLIRDRVNEKPAAQHVAEIVKGYLQGLLFGIYSEYLTREEHSVQEEVVRLNRKQDLYNRFMDLVQKEFATERNITYYAARLNVTPRYLSQVVYQESGHLASEHIRHFVMTEAKQLVQSQQYSIKQISQMLNFTSTSFFSRYFKKMTGYSPKEYQQL